MISVDDFTIRAPGAEVPEGVLTVCPRCGRVGAERLLDDGEAFVVHLQASELVADGLLTDELDCCRLAHA